MKKFPFAILATLFLCISSFAQHSFIKIEDGKFIRNGKPYHFVGTNYWYGALLGIGTANQKRLMNELDHLKSLGIENLRVLVGAEGGTNDYTVREALQPKQGKYDEKYLKGLDFLMSELGKRNMTAVLYLTNNWEWSGGLAQYLEWNGKGEIPNPNIPPNTWPQFMEYTSKFHSCEPCKTAFAKYVTFILKRTNSITGKKYTNDPSIFAWEVANEPRVFTKENEKAFTSWINDVVSLIDKLDSNHLITTGSEGIAGSNDDLETFERTHNNPKIDYLTMHIWPKNWGWYSSSDEEKTTPIAIEKTMNYIDEHIKVAQKLNKPIVLEEFGFPRSMESLDRNSSTKYRDAFYEAVLQRMLTAIEKNEPFVALNFWGYGGYGKNDPDNGKWNIGNDYTTDPPQEPQGLNSVFANETSTLKLLSNYIEKLNK